MALTLEEFTLLDRWVGGNDTAFAQFLYANSFHELDSFDDALVNAKVYECTTVELELRESTIDWSIPHGS